MHEVVRADSGWEALFWVIAVMFWGLTQLLNKKLQKQAKQKKSSAQSASHPQSAPQRAPQQQSFRKSATPSTRPVSPRQDVKAFFDQLQKDAQAAFSQHEMPSTVDREPQEEPPPEERVRVVSVPSKKYGKPKPLRNRRHVPVTQATAVQAVEEALKKQSLSGKMASNKGTGRIRSTGNALNIPMPRVPSVRISKSAHDASLPGDRERNPYRLNLQDRYTLRRAVLAAEIIGKPRALQPLT